MRSWNQKNILDFLKRSFCLYWIHSRDRLGERKGCDMQQSSAAGINSAMEMNTACTVTIRLPRHFYFKIGLNYYFSVSYFSPEILYNNCSRNLTYCMFYMMFSAGSCAPVCSVLLRKAEVDLCSGEAVKQDHAAGQEGAQDQAFAHGPPLPSLLASHGPTESNLKKQNIIINITIMVNMFLLFSRWKQESQNLNVLCYLVRSVVNTMTT